MESPGFVIFMLVLIVAVILCFAFFLQPIAAQNAVAVQGLNTGGAVQVRVSNSDALECSSATTVQDNACNTTLVETSPFAFVATTTILGVIGMALVFFAIVLSFIVLASAFQ